MAGSAIALVLGSCRLDIDLFARNSQAGVDEVAGFGGLAGGSSLGGGPGDSPAPPMADLVYSRPIELTVLRSGAGEAHPTLGSDGLTLYFATARQGWPRIWVTTREGIDQPWSPPTEAGELSMGVPSETAVTMPELSSDGLRLLYTRIPAGQQGELWSASRAEGSAPFSNLLEQGVDVPSWLVGSPGMSLQPSLLLLELVEDPDPGNVWVADGGPAGSWESARPLAELNSPAFDGAPWISDDALTVAFTSSRAGSDDIYVSRRSAVNEPFARPQNVASLNTEWTEREATFTQGMQVVVFSSTRDGEPRLYEARLVE